MEYLRLYTIANGVREAVAGSVNVLATQNADKAYDHFREGKNSMDTDTEAVYKKIIVALKKELVEEWEEQLKEDRITKASFVREAISKYMYESKERGKGHE